MHGRGRGIPAGRSEPPKGVRRRGLLAAAIGPPAAGAALLLLGPGRARAAHTADGLYRLRGPHLVTTGRMPGYVLHRPLLLGLGGRRHPILTWGNGTGSRPETYGPLLSHLASWGFVVIASTSSTTGRGNEMLAGVRLLAAADGDPRSAFHGALDTRRTGALGHSQGAVGAINATLASAGLITTTLCVALPDPRWIGGAHAFRLERLTGPVLFLGGGADTLIASPAAQRHYFDQAPGPAAVGVLRHAGHAAVQPDGGGFRGYLTAWLLSQLDSEARALDAFAGYLPEFLLNPLWQDQRVKDLA